MELVLKRTYFPKGANGMLIYESILLCYTIELPWLNNKPQRSCIPEGQYRLLIRYSRKHQLHFMLKDVPGRTLILIHPANNALKELKGCIAPVTTITGQGQGSESRKAFNKVKNLLLSEKDELLFITIKSK